MDVLFVALFIAVAIAALWFVPVHLWLREDVKFWRNQSEGWKRIAENGSALIERNHQNAVSNLEFADRILKSWAQFKYIILRDGQPVAEFTDASLARMAAVMFQSNEEANGNRQHVWTVEGD